MFRNYSNFEEKLESLYGISDEEAYADRQIRKLRQLTSVAVYASEFQGFAADLEWNDAALRSQFYLGLKDIVKERLTYEGSARTTLAQLIKAAKDMDERIQELRQDRNYDFGNFRRSPKATDRNSYGTVPMELDSAEAIPGGRNREERRCYRCGRKGHLANRCVRKRKGALNVLETVDHGWINCHDDDCETHREQKEKMLMMGPADDDSTGSGSILC